MTPAARTQAAIELLDAVIASAREGGAAADTLIARYFAARRYAGSKDRRAVRALVFAAIRAFGDVPASGRAAMLALAAEDAELAATFTGGRHAPAPMAANEPVATRGLVPQWLADALSRSGLDEGETVALLQRAPLDLRVNRLKADPAAVAAEFPGSVPVGDTALRLPEDSQVEGSEAWRAGSIEVQDLGSQLVTRASGAEPGMTVVDLCAGGGGKTLALAALMENRGRIIAADVDRTRLSRLPPRAARAGVTIAEMVLLNPGQEEAQLNGVVADVVLVDAPCSGTGTWRRNPEARWRLTPDRLARLAATQRHLLEVAAGLVRPGGALTYIVCSLLDDEGADQVDAFLASHPGWQAEVSNLGAGRQRGAGLRLTPAHDGTDGFFVARLIRPC